MKKEILCILTSIAFAGCASTAGGFSDASGSKKNAASQETSSLTATEQSRMREEVRNMRNETLEKLYAAHPDSREEINKAVGYAVFDAWQSNIIMLVTGSGIGVSVDNRTQHETFMRMARLGTGPGIGYKSFKLVLIFKERHLFDTFGFVGGDVTASGDFTVKLNDEIGGVAFDPAMSLNPFLSIYQVTEHGVLLQANWGGVGYLPYDDLNKPTQDDLTAKNSAGANRRAKPGAGEQGPDD